jgi:hypothetical protein
VTAVLLADQHDERRPVDPRRRERPDRVAETCGRVQQHERRLAPGERPAGRKPDDGPFVQSEHEPQVVRQAGEERHLGRTRVAEDRRETLRTEDVERRVADGLPAHGGSIPEALSSV